MKEILSDTGSALIGTTLSHYRVLERLGAGAMGEVYLAEDLRLHRPVALKLLHPELARDPEARGRLLREARAASALSHPSVAVIYEVDESPRDPPGLPFIAMEYVTGPTLADLIEAGPLELSRALRIAAHAAEALADAHAAGVVHRDVKPSNLKLTANGLLKVLDFGLADRRPLGESDSSTWTRDPTRRGGLVGTLAYMSPEQALGHAIDGRSDVFSLGVVLYEMLTGRRPFQGENAAQVLNAVLNAEPMPLSLPGSDARLPRVEALVRRMLEKRRDARPDSMGAVRDELRALEEATGSFRALVQPGGLRRALALLSFANITGRSEDDWLGAGLSETILAELRRVTGLEVVAPDAVEAARRRLGLQTSAPDEIQALKLGRELGAAFVVSGAYQRLGARVRVTALLLDAGAGALVHAAKVDGEAEQLFELQDRLARELIQHLEGAANPKEPAAYATQVVAAYELFSKGVLNSRIESHESLSRAILLFEQAVQLDPGYAQAHLELGSAYASQAGYLAADALAERALAAYRRALELRPDLVRAWRELGSALVALGRVDEGIQAIRKGLALDQNDAGALAAMGRALFIGRADFRGAATWLEQALYQNPRGGWYALQLAHCYALLRELAKGERVARRAIDLQEALLSGQQGIMMVGAYMRLGHVLALAERFEDAVAQFQCELAFLNKVDHALRTRIGIELHMRLGSAYRRLGRKPEAAAALQIARAAFEARVRLGADDPYTRYYAAGAYALLDEPQEALHCLALAAQRIRAFVVERARIEPEFHALRSDPRFERLVAARLD